MNRNLLFAVCAHAMAGLDRPPVKPTIRVVTDPQHTQNLFGPISEIAGKDLELLERNLGGDCLCLFHGSKGTNIVDVDYRDVETRIASQGAKSADSSSHGQKVSHNDSPASSVEKKGEAV